MKKVIIAVAIGLVFVALIITFGQVFTVRYVSVEFVNSVSSATKQQIINLADIDTHTNIFVIDETKIASAIENEFDDNAIRVSDIVREFPNKVVIRISERLALYKIEAETDENEKKYVATDRNFQRSELYSEKDLAGQILTTVTGLKIIDTYRTDECYALRDIANAFISCGIAEEALPYFMEEVDFSTEKIIITLRPTDSIFEISKNVDDIQAAINSLYDSYMSTDFALRHNSVFSY